MYKLLKSKISIINEINTILSKNPGKQLRSKIFLLVGKCLGNFSEKHEVMASVIEIIHNATLLHDDVLDNSDIRRGSETINSKYGSNTSILAGDFLYSRAFQIAVNVKEDIDILKILSTTTNQIVEGEMSQTSNINNIYLSESQYMSIIFQKTSVLFESTCEIAAILSNNSKYKNHVKNFGKHLGNCFQLVDDIMDYTGKETKIRKSTKKDLITGKVTLPLIYTIRNTNQENIQNINNFLKKKSYEDLNKVVDIVKNSGGIKYTHDKALEESRLAIKFLRNLPESSEKDNLITACQNIAQIQYQ